jgi:predicted ATPase
MYGLVGRERELSSLRNTLERACQGKGSLVLVSGEAGIGKTSLLQRLIAEAREQGALVLTGAAYDHSATPPYGPWLEITDRYRADDTLPELPDALKRGTGIGDLQTQTELFEFVRDFFVQVADRRSLVLMLEDLHWSDRESLELLRFLGRSIEVKRILIVATYRDDEVNRRHALFALLPSLIRESRTTRVSLSSLTLDEVRALLDLHYSLPRSDRDRLANYLSTRAEGNPLFTVEVLRTLEQSEHLAASESGWTVADLSRVPMPSLVQQVIERRLSQLDEQAVGMLEIASVFGQVVPFDLWQSASEATGPEFDATLEQAIEAHLLVEVPESAEFRFSHWLVRQAVYERIAILRRRRLHRQVGDLLAATPSADPDIVADHFQRAGDHRAIDWLIRAAERAQDTYAWLTAAERFKSVVDLMASDPTRARERGWLLCHLGWIKRHSDPAAGIPYLEQARQIAREIGDSLLDAVALRAHDADARFLHEPPQLLAGPSADGAVAGEDDRPAGGADR